MAATASVASFAIGGILGYLVYIARKIDPQIVSRSIFTRAIWTFLYNRWYLNTALYWGAVIGPMAIYRIIWRYFETTIIDGINPGFKLLLLTFQKSSRPVKLEYHNLSFRIGSGAYENSYDVILIGEIGELKWLISFDSSGCDIYSGGRWSCYSSN